MRRVKHTVLSTQLPQSQAEVWLKPEGEGIEQLVFHDKKWKKVQGESIINIVSVETYPE